MSERAVAMNNMVIDHHINYLHQKNYTLSEIQFILAHESIHIFRNHIISNVVWSIIDQIKGPNNVYANFTDLLKVVSALFSSERLPPNAVSIRNNEYEADDFAVRYVTGDFNSAKSCLTKLCDGNLKAESHLWEFRERHFPLMTMEERITELRTRVNSPKYL